LKTIRFWQPFLAIASFFAILIPNLKFGFISIDFDVEKKSWVCSTMLQLIDINQFFPVPLFFYPKKFISETPVFLDVFILTFPSA
jgi:hypothetical protein